GGGFLLCIQDSGAYHWNAGDANLSEVPEFGRRPCNAAVIDRKGRLWVGFTGGVVAMYDGRELHRYSDEDGLAGGDVTAICEDRRGTIWVGTSSGLNRFKDDHFVA